MESHKILMVIFLVLGLLGMIRDDGLASAGDLSFMHVNVVNNEGEGFDDLSVRLYIYGLGLITQTNSFDLNDGDSTSKLIFWDVPSDAAPGDYWVRITISNDDVREVEHRLITIV